VSFIYYGCYGSNVSPEFFTSVGSEDCLYMNIYRPATDSKNLPVLVFVPGGSSKQGSIQDPNYDGNHLAKKADIIVVTVQYRLNYFGYISHPALKDPGDPESSSGNFGLLDVIKALNFVKNNIESFGGDPNNVTLSGESAGSQVVNCLLVSPLAKGLFSKAVCLSAPLFNYTPALAASNVPNLIRQLMINDGSAAAWPEATTRLASMSNADIKTYLYSKTSDEIVNAQISPGAGYVNGVLQPGFQKWSSFAPIDDGYVMPADSYHEIMAGNFTRVPILYGNTNEEGKLFSYQATVLAFNSTTGVATPYPRMAYKITDAERYHLMMTDDPNNPSILLTDVLDPAFFALSTPETLAADYTSYTNVDDLINNTHTYPSNITPGPAFSSSFFKQISVGTIHYQNLTDGQAHSAGAIQFAANTPVYYYQFDWAQQKEPWRTLLGACHLLDVPFIFGNFCTTGAKRGLFAQAFSEENSEGRKELSDLMIKSIKAFMTTGNPNNQELAALGIAWPRVSTTVTGNTLHFDANFTDVTPSVK